MFCLVHSAVFVFILNGLCLTSSSDSPSSTIEFSKNVAGYILSPQEFRGSSTSFCITLRNMYKNGRCEKQLVKIYEVCDTKPNEIFQAPCSLQLDSKTFIDNTYLRVHDFLFTDSPSYVNFFLADNSCLRKHYRDDQLSVQMLDAKECRSEKKKRDRLAGRNTPLDIVVIDYQSEESSSADSESENVSDFASLGTKSKIEEKEQVKPVSAKPDKNVIEFSTNVDGYTLSSREFQGSSKSFCVTIRNMYKDMKCEKQLVTVSRDCKATPYETFQAPCSLQLSSATFVDDVTLRIGDFLFTDSQAYLNFIMADESCGRKDYKKDRPDIEKLNVNQCLILKQKIGQLTEKNTQLDTISAPGYSDDGSSSEDNNSQQNPYFLGYRTNSGILKPNGDIEPLDKEMSSFQVIKNVHYIVPDDQEEQSLRGRSSEDDEHGSANSKQMKSGKTTKDSVPEDYPSYITGLTADFEGVKQQIHKLEEQDDQDSSENQEQSSPERTEQRPDGSSQETEEKDQHYERNQHKPKTKMPSTEAKDSQNEAKSDTPTTEAANKDVPVKTSVMNRLLRGAKNPIRNLFSKNKKEKEFRVVLVYVKNDENKKKE